MRNNAKTLKCLHLVQFISQVSQMGLLEEEVKLPLWKYCIRQKLRGAKMELKIN